MKNIVMAIIFSLLAAPVYGGEISILGGYGVTDNPTQKAGAYQVEYLEGLGEHFAWSFSYMNQGHFFQHHRDANAINPISSTGSSPLPSGQEAFSITTP